MPASPTSLTRTATPGREIEVFVDDRKLALEPGQTVMPHGIDRGLDPDEILKRGNGPARP